MAAARAWWLLRYFGHPQVSVLDGGFGGWVAAGHAIERGAVAVEPGDFIAAPRRDAVARRRRRGRAGAAPACCWTRGRRERFRGEHEPIDPVAGHIPGR